VSLPELAGAAGYLGVRQVWVLSPHLGLEASKESRTTVACQLLRVMPGTSNCRPDTTVE
jgi:hypothetical protein